MGSRKTNIEWGKGGGDCLKKIFKGTWEERDGVVFSTGEGVDTPMHTMTSPNQLNPL